MDYVSTIQYLYHAAPLFQNIGAGAYKEGLSNTHTLDEHFGHPHTHYRTIHIAGTNGKGSVSSCLAAILQSAGLKVGLYTSPHLVDFRERIRVNGAMIPEQRVVDFVEQERSFFEPLSPSFFELTTALAFLYFAEQQVDVAVIEVGLGGRLDCTNIITPDLSVITNISFDHQQFLGNTLAAIAAEKAGIIKSGIPVVIGETNGHAEVRDVFENTAIVRGSSIRFADEESMSVIGCELKGKYQRANMNTVQCALDELRKQPYYASLLTAEAVQNGLARVTELTGLRGRWQTLREQPALICDVGHNVAGIRYVVRQLLDQPCKHLHIVFGMVNDKDYAQVLVELEKLSDHATYYFTQPSCQRALPVDTLARAFIEKEFSVETYSTVRDAVCAALQKASPDDCIFVGGSCYVVADLLESSKIQ
ncbi:MAG: bifunctional folylpolyglutamate synthase/dihydrofolate synthase [Bacteroidaceae bacterium]|nr:bifunctional folylpolyglutamate synthase/dihydrofolate synthase [Bacteroidaceae bacterium]